MTIKTKEKASLWLAFVAAVVVAVIMILCNVQWWVVACVAVAMFVVMALFSLQMIKSYVAYKLKPIYSMVLSRHVRTNEIVDEMKDKHVEDISDELTAWVEDNDKEIARLKQNEVFRKQYLNIALNRVFIYRTGRRMTTIFNSRSFPLLHIRFSYKTHYIAGITVKHFCDP